MTRVTSFSALRIPVAGLGAAEGGSPKLPGVDVAAEGGGGPAAQCVRWNVGMGFFLFFSPAVVLSPEVHGGKRFAIRRSIFFFFFPLLRSPSLGVGHQHRGDRVTSVTSRSR